MGRLIGVTLLFVAAASAQQYVTYAGVPVSRQSYLRKGALQQTNPFRDSRLVAWYPLAEGGTINPRDAVRGTSATWGGTAAGTNGYYSEGQTAANAGHFNGTNTRADCSDTGLPTGNSARSMAVWVYPTSRNSFGVIMGYGSSGVNLKEWDLGFDTTMTKIGAFIVSVNPSAFSTTTVPLNAWTHIGITYDGTTLRYYFNGVADGTATYSSTPNTTLNGSCRIGRFNDASPGSFGMPGRIQDLRVYNAALSANEMFQVYLAGSRVSGTACKALAGQNPYNTSTVWYAFNGNCSTFGAAEINYSSPTAQNPALMQLRDGSIVLAQEDTSIVGIRIAVSVDQGATFTTMATITSGCGSVGCRPGGMGGFFCRGELPCLWSDLGLSIFSDDGVVGHGIKIWITSPSDSTLTLWAALTQITGSALTFDPFNPQLRKVGSNYYLAVKDENGTLTLKVCVSTVSWEGPYNTACTDYSGTIASPAESYSLVDLPAGVKGLFYTGSGSPPSKRSDWVPGFTPSSPVNIVFPGISAGFEGVMRIVAGSLR